MEEEGRGNTYRESPKAPQQTRNRSLSEHSIPIFPPQVLEQLTERFMRKMIRGGGQDYDGEGGVGDGEGQNDEKREENEMNHVKELEMEREKEKEWTKVKEEMEM